jgi:hypothetical protein
VLEAAKVHASKDVIVISCSRGGSAPYIATSMPHRCAAEFDAQIHMLQDAINTLKRIKRKEFPAVKEVIQ